MATYKGIQGYSVQKLSDDPGTLSEVVGQLWYNSTSGDFKVSVQAAGAWAAGGSLNTGRMQLPGGGIQTSAIVFGGTAPPSTYANTELYDGTSWTETADLLNSRGGMCCVGQTQSAVLGVGGYKAPPTGFSAAAESWNGTSWSEGTDIASGRKTMGAAGTNTAGIIFGGAGEFGQVDLCETWNGSAWTEVADLNTARRAEGGCGEVSTAALCAAGEVPASPYMNANTETWDGTSWTEVNDLNTARFEAAMSGTSTLAVIFGGGAPGVTANTETWDGTSWTEVANLGSARKSAASTSQSSTLALCAGGTPPPSNTAVEEWSGSPVTAKVVTVS